MANKILMTCVLGKSTGSSGSGLFIDVSSSIDIEDSYVRALPYEEDFDKYLRLLLL
jgi:hypothetical protein